MAKKEVHRNFTIEQCSKGLWRSFDLDGNPVLSSLTKDHLIMITSWKLNRDETEGLLSS
jgi:hypothetical protein|tara:strand:+ start:5275 stop:5451 length:177 start_codon:yes stop_codon:yes gene_type:complete